MNSLTKTEASEEPGNQSDAIVAPEITSEDIIVLDVWKLMGNNPAFKDLPKPGIDYILYFLKEQEDLKTLAYVEKREYLLSLIMLGWIRDSIYAKVIAAEGEWMDTVGMKPIRVAMKAMEVQSNMLSKVYEADKKAFTETEAGTKIVAEVRRFVVEIENKSEQPESDSDVVDADFEVVEDGKEESD